MSNLKYFLILPVFLILSFVGLAFFSSYAHGIYLDNVITRLSSSAGGNVNIKELTVENGFLSQLRSYKVEYMGKKLGFTLMVRTSFYPLYEVNEFMISNISGELIACPYCEYKDLEIVGGWKVNYLKNSYEGMYHQSGSNNSFASTRDNGTLSVSGISGDFRGTFRDRWIHFGVKVDQIMNDNPATKFNTSIKFLSGDIDVYADPGVFRVDTRGLSINKYESKNVSSGEKIMMDNAKISFSTESTGNLSNIDVSMGIKSFEHANPEWSNDFKTENNTFSFKVSNADQSFWVDFSSLLYNLVHLDDNAGKFNFGILENLRRNNSVIAIDRLMLVSKDNRGVLKIEKGSEIKFVPGKKDVKDSLDLSLKFVVNDAFINDFPDGKKYKQLFLNNDWFVQTNSKDEYLTQLTVKFGQCTIGESILEGC
jgi:hypothetical protein